MKFLKILVVLITFLLLHPVIDGSNNLYAQGINFPAIFSTTQRPNRKKTSTQFHYAERLVQFIGKRHDTLNFTESDIRLVQNYRISTGGMYPPGDNPPVGDSGLAIIIDTSQIVGVNERNSGTNPAFTIYDAYPVLIENISSSRLIVGFGRKILMKIEALDAGGNWRTIQADLANGPETSGVPILLRPRDIIGVGVPVFSGNFKTLLRVKVFDNYSEPFTGYINQSQFSVSGQGQ